METSRSVRVSSLFIRLSSCCLIFSCDSFPPSFGPAIRGRIFFYCLWPWFRSYSSRIFFILLFVLVPGLERTALVTAYPGYVPVKSVNTRDGRIDILKVDSEKYAFF